MMAALSALNKGDSVSLFEQNEKLGKKLFLTGKGRCNVTNSCDMEELFNNVVNNSKFMYSAFYGFDNQKTQEFFEGIGLRLKEERGNRIFPVSDHSSDVIKALSNELKRLGCKIYLNTGVKQLIIESVDNEADMNDAEVKADKNSAYEGNISGVVLGDGHKLYFDKVIMATGGLSYKSTGSDGKSFGMLDSTKVTIKPFKPALVPLTTNDDSIVSLQGLSLKNVSLKMLVDNKKRYEGFGEMLFTHFGVSGPLVLSASSYLKIEDYNKKIICIIDLKSALDEQSLDERILRDFSTNMNKDIGNVLGLLLPQKIIDSVLLRAGIDAHKKVHDITKNDRVNLIAAIKKFSFEITGNRGFDEAIITSGGVATKEINPSTMESKKVSGLYFAGEMIDVDALTGGFNLQIAWSTGYLAGAN